MSLEVGGRLEAVAPRRSIYGRDYWRIAILLAAAAAIHTWLVVHTAIPARDSIAFARVANNLSSPSAGAKDGETRQRIDVIRTAEQPPGYPITVWVTEKALRLAIPDPRLPERSLLATQIANAVAAVFLVIPMYLTGRILFGRNAGFAAALLFQVMPVPARITSDGLSEGVYLLVVATAVLLGVRAARRPTIGGFLLCGIATGTSYLVRPEGLLVALGVGIVIVLAGLSRKWPRDVAAGRLIALGVGLALVGVPYMILIGKISNKPTSDHLVNPLDDHPAPIWLKIHGEGACKDTSVPRGLLATWWDPRKHEGKSRELWAIGAVWVETSKSLHYVIGALALFGLVARRRQMFAPDRGIWVMVAIGLFNLMLLIYLAARIGYVSERHTVLFTMLACTFAAAALEPLAVLLESLPGLGRLIVWPKAAPGGILLALVAATLPYTLKPLHAHREGHKHAGLWLAANMNDGDWLKDPLAWGEYYAGRTLYRPPVYHGRPKHVWVIVEKGKGSPHSRLPQWEEAVRLTTDREAVYRWPGDAPPGGPVVEVHRLTFAEYGKIMSRSSGPGEAAP